jgi:hypothetical protein
VPETCALDGAHIGIDDTGVVLRSVLPDASGCPICRGSCTITTFDDQQRAFASPCPGAETARRGHLLDRCKLPASGPFATATMATIPGAFADRLLSITIPGQGLWLHGGVGGGKTRAVVAFLRHLCLDRGIPCRFYSLDSLLADIRSTYGKSPDRNVETEQDILERVAREPVLALDDVAKLEGKGDFEVRVLSSIVERRYNSAGLTTLVTSNLSPGELGDAGDYGMGWSMKRIVRRLTEMAQPLNVQPRRKP